VNQVSQSTELANAFAQIEHDNQMEPDALVSHGQLLSRDSPAHGGTAKNSKQIADTDAQGATAGIAGQPPESKKKYTMDGWMASVESNAKSYLKQLENEANANDSDKSSGERPPGRFANFPSKGEKHDEKLMMMA